MKKTFIALALAFQSALAFPQINVSGRVTDGQSGDPIPGANVHAIELQQGTATDANGEYILIIDEGAAPVKIVFSFVGYQKKEFDVNRSQTIDVALTPSIHLEEIIIRSVRADESAPITQSTLQRKEIKEVYNGEDPQFFLAQMTPSITVESESGTFNNNYGKMRLRGIDQKRMNITLNGVPLNDMIDHGVYFSNFADFGASIESIQIQRGVGASATGVASYAGSINFESVNLEDRDAGSEFQLGGGSYNSYRASVEHFTGRLESGSAFYGRFSHIWSDGYRDNVSTNAYSFFLSGGFFLDKDLIKINAFTANTKNGLGYELAPMSLIRENPKVNILDENDIEDFGQRFLQVQHSKSLSPYLSLVSSAYYGGASGDFPWGYRDNGVLTQYNYPLVNDHFGLMSNLHFTESDDLILDGGIHAYTFRRRNMEQIVPDYSNPYYDERSRKDEIAAFAKAEYRIDNWTLYGDVQMRAQELRISPDYAFMDTVNLGDISHQWFFVNPKVGLSYAAGKRSNVYFSFGRSGREPAKRDIIGSFTLDKEQLSRTMQEDFVKPEYVNDFEAGYRFDFPVLKGQVNLFYMDFRNELAPTGALIALGSSLRENVAKSYRRGIETELAVDLGKLYINTAMAYMESRIVEIEFSESVPGKLEAALTPNWNLNHTVGYRPFDDLEIQLTGRYVGDYFTDMTNNPDYVIPSYYILNSRVIYQLNKHFSLNCELNNLFNKRYYSFGAPIDPDFDGEFDELGYLPAAGRNGYITLTASF